jgi:hypothetical protein
VAIVLAFVFFFLFLPHFKVGHGRFFLPHVVFTVTAKPHPANALVFKSAPGVASLP